MPKHKHYHLTARQDFGPYKKGDHIEDEAEVNRILDSESRVHVIRVFADVEPEEKGDVAPAERSKTASTATATADGTITSGLQGFAEAAGKAATKA